jgi:hypothetical protein
MDVREVGPSDKSAILTLALESWPDAPFKTQIPNLDRIGLATDWFLSSQDAKGWILEEDGAARGVLGVILTTHMFTGQRLAIQWWWWCQPQARNGSGLKLLRALEKWAAESGISAIQLIAPTATFRSLCERLDYSPVEMTYQKDL